MGHRFEWDMLMRADRDLARGYIHALYRQPDLIIMGDDGTPYLYRWHVTPRGEEANIYFHVQVNDDPERPLHDHPWDNMSVILRGGYREQMLIGGKIVHFMRRQGDVVFRRAAELHRLEMLPDVPYTMSQFTTGPKVKDWGFQLGKRWVYYRDLVTFDENRTVFRVPEHLKDEYDVFCRYGY